MAFTEIDVSRDPALRAAMTQRAQGRPTVPQIFVGETHVGGCDDLYALDHAGKLDPLLAAEAMRAGLVQLTVTDDPAANLAGHAWPWSVQAAAGGAGFVLTPECTNCLSSSRAHQRAVFHAEETDPTLAALRDEAARAGHLAADRLAGPQTTRSRWPLCQPQLPDRPGWRDRRAL